MYNKSLDGGAGALKQAAHLDLCSSHARGRDIALLKCCALSWGHDDILPEPVAPPDEAHFLDGHALGLRQEEDDIEGHHDHPEGEENVCPSAGTEAVRPRQGMLEARMRHMPMSLAEKRADFYHSDEQALKGSLQHVLQAEGTDGPWQAPCMQQDNHQ